MITDIKPGDGSYKMTGKVFWPLFNCDVQVSWGDIAYDESTDVSTEYAEKCVSQLLNLDLSGTEELLKASIRYFYDEEYCLGEPIPFDLEFEGMEYPKELDTPANILPYIKPVEMYIDEEVAGCYSISVFSECAWEPEHGLKWVVRNGKPLYVGAGEALGSHEDEDLYLEIWEDANYLVSRWGRQHEG